MRNEINLFPEHAFVPVEQEQEYLSRNHLGVERLPNGVTIIRASRQVEDLADASINVHFATGALNDPKDKIGAHHLLEHVACSPKIQEEARHFGASINGGTSVDNYMFLLQGTANRDVRNYGVWLYLDRFVSMLKDPWKEYDDITKGVDKERNIVRRELHERHSSDDFKEKVWRQGLVFDPTSSISFSQFAGGTEEGLANTHLDDLVQLSKKVLIPDQTVVSILSEGDRKISEELSTTLMEAFSNFPNSEQVANPVDPHLQDLLHPRLKQGEVYLRTEGEIKNVRNVNLLWVVPHRPYTVERAALNRISTLLSQTTNDFVRETGISYGGRFTNNPLEKITLCDVRFMVHDRSDIGSYVQNEVLPKLQQQWSQISEETLNLVNQNEKLIQLATPLQVKSRFSSLIEGIKDYGRVLDADKMQARYSSITVGDLSAWKDIFVNQPPAVFIY